MVDSIGFKGATASVDPRTLATVAPAQAPKLVVGDTPDTSGSDAATTASALSRSMAASPPVDRERVAQIRKAIQDGKFPLVSSTVADRLLALKLEWNGDAHDAP